MRAKHIRKANTRRNMGPRTVQYNHPGRELANAQGLFWCPDMLNNVNRTADVTRLPDKRSKAWRVTESLMHETDGGTFYIVRNIHTGEYGVVKHNELGNLY